MSKSNGKCKECGKDDHTRRSSKKCPFHIPRQKRRFLDAATQKEFKETPWTLKGGFAKFCSDPRVREKIERDVIECSALAVEASIYVHFYCTKMLRENRWPSAEQFCQNDILNFYYHLQNKSPPNQRIQRDAEYFQLREKHGLNYYSGKHRTYLIQALAKQHQTAWMNCITVHLTDRLVKFGNSFIGPHLSKWEWKLRLEHELLLNQTFATAMSEETWNLLQALNCDIKHMRDYKTHWWELSKLKNIFFLSYSSLL